jgi:4-hydroxy-tetrahydrodipicolinate synthase
MLKAHARKLQLEAIDLIDSLFCEVNPIPVKTALNIMGKEVRTASYADVTDE